MASKARVLAYFEECEVAKNFAAVTQGMTTQLARQSAEDGNSYAEESFLDQTAMYAHIQEKLLERVAEVYCNVYTDEEIDQLTAVFHLPISARGREILPEMQRQLAIAITGLQTDMVMFMLKHEFGKIVDEAMA